jgi:hypothetical protein
MGGLFTRYSIDAAGTRDGARIALNAKQKENNFNYGLSAFFDATYAALSFAYAHGEYSWSQRSDLSSWGGTSSWDGKRDSLRIGLYGKYPFTPHTAFTLAPLLGVEYQVMLRDEGEWGGAYFDRPQLVNNDKNGDRFSLSAWNAFWISVGGQLDYHITPHYFVRGELLCAFRLPTPYELDGLSQAKSQTGDSSPTVKGITMAPRLNVSVGYRFLTTD